MVVHESVQQELKRYRQELANIEALRRTWNQFEQILRAAKKTPLTLTLRDPLDCTVGTGT
jgi:hypothetical protein